MPPRPLSRNSTSVSCVPTATIIVAPFSSASSIAMSSLVAAAGNVMRGHAELLHPGQARARARPDRRAR